MEQSGTLFNHCYNCNRPWAVPENCQHVKCLNPDCLMEFCFLCSAPRSQTLAHGNHYHRRGCAFFTDCCDKKCIDTQPQCILHQYCGTNVSKKENQCLDCIKQGKACDSQPPLPPREGDFIKILSKEAVERQAANWCATPRK